jgi:hypothetical protein
MLYIIDNSISLVEQRCQYGCCNANNEFKTFGSEKKRRRFSLVISLIVMNGSCLVMSHI